MIYLDNNATTPLLPEAAEAMAECARRSFGNPASQHAAGRRARQALEDAREGIADLLGVDLNGTPADQLIFTSGGTEANNLAMFGLAGERPAHLIISEIEHPSIIEPAESLARRGWQVDRAGVSADGQVIVDQVAHLLRPETRLVAVMLGNNETGVLQPVEPIARLCQQRGVPVLTDAVQVAGKLPVDFRALGVTAMSIAAHKFHGPIGIGALALRAGVSVEPRLLGGHQQAGLRPGTEAVPLIVGMYAALAASRREQDARRRRLESLREQFERTLLAECLGVVVNGGAAPRLPQTSNLAFPGVDGQALVMALDLAGVACSTGSACASGSSQPSPTLLAMGLDKSLARGSLRCSFGVQTTAEEAAEAARQIVRIYQELASRATT
ncbi:MAG TPA: cysteine desulfurase family protein [Pirellulales bacterium]|nr:cysteine desulfurase family protein [Pirellulales bacterium]